MRNPNRNLCFRFCGLLAVLLASLPLGGAIVGSGRDLLLTPKPGQQLNGKRIFYEEEKEEEPLRRRSQRPWERTLKHVTYVTLFTDAAVSAAAGNLSQLHEYHDFLQTPYIPADAQSGALAGSASSRFGDIVTLAKGYLEQVGPGPGNATYRFFEGGTCFQLKCPQASANQRRALWQVQRIRHRDGESGRSFHYEMKFSVTPLESQAWQPHQPMSYIQKESDYPGSFGRFTRDPGFAQRRQDRERAAEQSQATFNHGIFQPPPPPLPPVPPALPPKLNIGEYLKGNPKLELFPGLFNLGLRPNYVAPTTFRPNYPPAVKFVPEMERLPHSHTSHKNEVGQPPLGGGGEATPGAVTHHFHHHFYVAPAKGETDLAYRLPASTPASHPPRDFYPQRQAVQFPSSHSASLESEEDPHELLRTPQIYGQASKYQTAKLPPLLIYAGAEEDRSFVQSEPLEETVYRYSEPDPLYVHQNPIDILREKEQEQEEEQEREQGQGQEQEHEQEQEEQQQEHQHEPEQQQEPEQASGQDRKGEHPTMEQPELVTTAAPASPAPTEATEATEASTSSPTTTTTPQTTPTTSSSSSFVSTSTHFSPLRSISRYRTTPRITAGRSTTTTTSTTTEPPYGKWAKRRKEQDSKAKSSLLHEAIIATSSTTTTTTEAATPPPRPVVEVLTQKSVSRSVSIKVGENGEEIPILVDDEENEVKPLAPSKPKL